jgi:hypothetical protein
MLFENLNVKLDERIKDLKEIKNTNILLDSDFLKQKFSKAEDFIYSDIKKIYQKSFTAFTLLNRV